MPVDPNATPADLIQPATWPVYPTANVTLTPVGIYKVQTVELQKLQSKFDSNVSVTFDDTAAQTIDLTLGAGKAALQVVAKDASNVVLNAEGQDVNAKSGFVLQSGSSTNTVTIATDILGTGLTTSQSQFKLGSSQATGQAVVALGTDTVTIGSASAAQAQAKQLTLVGSNVDVQAAVLNANADVYVKGGKALQAVGGALAVGQTSASTDFTKVTIGGSGSDPATTVATFTTLAAGVAGAVPQVNISAGSSGNYHLFQGSNVGINMSSTYAAPKYELDVQGRIAASTSVNTCNVFALPGTTEMRIGWDNNTLNTTGTIRKLTLAADEIEMLGDIDMFKSDLRVMDTAIYLGHIPQDDLGNVVTEDVATSSGLPGTYADTHYDGAGLVLWNLPDGFNAYASSTKGKAESANVIDYQQSIRWYQRGGMFTATNDAILDAWKRSSWEVAGGNLMMRAVTGHASYMFAIDYADGDSLKLYKVDATTVTEVAAFNSQ